MEVLFLAGARLPSHGNRRAADCRCGRSPATTRARPRRWSARVGDDGGRASQSSGRKVFLDEIPLISFEELRTSPLAFAKTGAYAIFDDYQTLRYVGYTRNMFAKLRLHASLQPDACRYFKAYQPDTAEKMTPEHLEAVLDTWIVHNGSIPSGNSMERAKWETTSTTRQTPIPRRTRDSETIVQRIDDARASDDVDDAFPRARPYRRQYETDGQYDPFDPFSASRESSRTSVGSQMLDSIVFNDTWYPIVLVSGLALFLWVLNLSMQTYPTV